MAIRVAVSGAVGRMGREVLKTVELADDLELVAACDRTSAGSTVADLLGFGDCKVEIKSTLADSLNGVEADVLVEFTHFSSAVEHSILAMEKGIAVVIGTSGIGPNEVEKLKNTSEATGNPVTIIPNFAVGAVLMMKFAEMAAEWLPNVELIELHHDGKLDAPSGTAMNLAHRLAEARKTTPAAKQETIKAEGARGADVAGIRVHSVRLPGFVAHNETIFGGNGEILTIRHDSMNRESFMEGVKLAVRKVRSTKGLTVGLDQFMF